MLRSFLLFKYCFWQPLPPTLELLKPFNYSFWNSSSVSSQPPQQPEPDTQVLHDLFPGETWNTLSSSQRINQWLTKEMITPKVQLGENLSLLILLPGQVLHWPFSWGKNETHYSSPQRIKKFTPANKPMTVRCNDYPKVQLEEPLSLLLLLPGIRVGWEVPDRSRNDSNTAASLKDPFQHGGALMTHEAWNPVTLYMSYAIQQVKECFLYSSAHRNLL